MCLVAQTQSANRDIAGGHPSNTSRSLQCDLEFPGDGPAILEICSRFPLPTPPRISGVGIRDGGQGRLRESRTNTEMAFTNCHFQNSEVVIEVHDLWER